MSEGFPTNHAHLVRQGGYGIPYKNPFTGRGTYYVPDFFVIYVDKTGKKHAEIIEIKPLDELPPAMSGLRGKVSKLKEARQIMNAAKWRAAFQFCKQRGWIFRVITEQELFGWKPDKYR